MNIPSIGVSTQTNYNKQNLAFGNYESSITKKSLKAIITHIDEDFQLGLSKGLFKRKLNSLTGKLWNSLQSMKAKYRADKVVDVNPFIDGQKVWVMVKPSKEILSKQFLNGYGQSNFGIFSEYVISSGQNLKKSVNDHADDLRKQYQHLVN